MIAFDDSGKIFYTSSGVKISYGPMDGLLYANLNTVRTAQNTAAIENAASAGAYNNLLADAHAQDLAGQPYTIPVKPLMKTVADDATVAIDGTVPFTMVPFSPPLADFVPRVQPPTGGMFSPGAGVGTTSDPNQLMRNQVSAMFHKMFPGA